MDDPIFEPWTDTTDPADTSDAVDASEVTAEPVGEGPGVGASRSASAEPDAGGREPGEVRAASEPDAGGREAGGLRSSSTEAGPTPEAPRWKSPTGARGVPASRPVPDAPASARRHLSPERSRRLRESVLPRLEWLARGLQAGGHRTILDERLDDVSPSLRFRFAPRPSPFEDPAPVEGAVLEITSGPPGSLHIVGRLWLDPLSTDPSEEVHVPAPKITEEWIDRLLLDFVSKALRPQ